MKTEIAGIDKNWVTDTFIGLFVFLGVVIVNFLIPGIATIGIPSVTQSIASATGRLIVVTILAPIFETAFFFGIVLFLFHDKFKWNFLLSAIVSSLIFMLFHVSAYGSFGTSSGAYLSAFVMGMVFAYETKYTNSIVPAIVTHALLNFFIAYLSLAVVIA